MRFLERLFAEGLESFRKPRGVPSTSSSPA
jgi:hypothetical protein